VVKDVVISTQNISITLRSSLKNLLLSARDKFQLNKSNNSDSKTKYDIDKRLAMLLRRDDFRLNMSYDFLVQLNFDSNKRSARLLNISSTGAAIEFFERGQLPEVDSETKFQLLLPGHLEPLSLIARVVWSRKPTKGTISSIVTMGLQFKNIDEKTRSYLWDFIVNAETSAHT
jgi:c-di-GMP-binding flagellar brake protein YcgR